MKDDPYLDAQSQRRAGVRPVQSLWPVWMSLCSSQLAFAGVTTLLPPASPQNPTAALLMGVAALGPALLSLSWGRLVARSVPAQTRWIVRWALAEAVTLMGLGSWSGAGLLGPVAAMMATGFVLILVQFPRDEGRP